MMSPRVVLLISIICLLTTTIVGWLAGTGMLTAPTPWILGASLVLPAIVAFTKATPRIVLNYNTSWLLVAFLTINFTTLLNIAQDASLSATDGGSAATLVRLGARMALNAGVIIWHFSVRKDIAEAIQRWGIYLICFAFLTALSIPLSDQVAYSFGRWLDLFLFLFASLFVFSGERISAQSILMSGFLSLFLVIGGLWFWWLIDPEPLSRVVYVADQSSTSIDRLARFGGNVLPPGTMGFAGASLTLLSLYAIRSTAASIPFLPVLAGALGLLTVVRSEARTALVAMLIAALWIIASQVGGRNGKYTALSFLWCGSVGFLGWLLVGADTTVLSRHPGDTSISNLTGRTDLWRDVINTFTDNPEWWPFGAGFNTLSSTFRMGALITESAHNGYLQMLVGTGILGLLAYLSVLGLVTSAAITVYDPLLRSSLISILILIIIHNFAEIGALVMMNPATLIAVVATAAALRAYPSFRTQEVSKGWREPSHREASLPSM